MKIISYPLGELQANCYFLTQGTDLILIDPADSADFILEEISRQNLNLLAMFATHGHFDHIMAAGEIQISTNAPFYIFKEDEFLVRRLEQTAKHFLGHTPAILKPQKYSHLKKGEMKIGPFAFEVLHIPGHTPGCAAYYFQKEDAIFTGDTLFKNAIGRYDFSYSSKQDLKNSLDRLFELPAHTIVYSGHEDLTTIGEERERALEKII
jgi:glyoxylase-like metal-dependent hydrolase (beta-lactamase superfamily II)